MGRRSDRGGSGRRYADDDCIDMEQTHCAAQLDVIAAGSVSGDGGICHAFFMSAIVRTQAGDVLLDMRALEPGLES